jgi:small conductance mechanosensitive channel
MENLQLIVDWADRDLVSIVIGFAAGILTFLIGRWLAKVLTRYASRSMERANLDPLVIRFTKNLIYIGLMAAVTIAALSQVGIHTTSLTALLAAGAVAIGLAIKDSLSNLAAGVMILLFRPYTLDNNVDAGGVSGAVEEVQIFSTILRTPDNVRVIVPNSAVMNSNIKNYSAYENRRIDLVIGIGYEDNIGTARDLLIALMTAHPRVLPTPPPSVEVAELAASSVNLALRAWTATADYGQVRAELLEQIKLQLDERGISLPYPQQVVYMRHLDQGAK